jgi:CRP/FNR family cyclic AMP-dependent transcriptional regulator
VPNVAESALFDLLPDSLRRLALRGEVKHFRKDQRLIEEGTLGDTLFIILSGRLRAFSADDRGREIVYGIYGPGEYLGEMSLDGGPRSASVVAQEAAVCAVITRHTLHEYVAANPSFAFELIGRVIQRARIATRSARSMALLDVYGRVVQLLEQMAVADADGTRVVRERLTHQEIANRVGCSREMVSRLMKDLDKGGHVQNLDGELRLAHRLPLHW